jgi:hypothetical protein
MPDDKPSGEKKIIVDEDWKSQVQAEKEAAQKQAATQSKPQAAPDEAMPAPTLTFLAGTLYLQGAIAMGLLPNPAAGDRPEIHPNQARHAIDLLAMLQQKTEGNRTPEESEELETMLHQLRLAYVGIAQQ